MGNNASVPGDINLDGDNNSVEAGSQFYSANDVITNPSSSGNEIWTVSLNAPTLQNTDSGVTVSHSYNLEFHYTTDGSELVSEILMLVSTGLD